MAQTLFEFLDKRKKKKDKEIALLKKKFNSLSLVDRNAYESIVENHTSSSLFLCSLYIIPKTIIFVIIFIYCLMFVTEVDLMPSLKIIIFTLLKYWIVFILVGLIYDFINEINSIKLKRELLLRRK